VRFLLSLALLLFPMIIVGVLKLSQYLLMYTRGIILFFLYFKLFVRSVDCSLIPRFAKSVRQMY
jgi:hypothetical protein